MSAWVNFDDVVDQLIAHGFQEPRNGWAAGIDTGTRRGVRTKVEGKSQKGWYALHTIRLEDGREALVGAFGWWDGAEQSVEKFKLNIDGQAPSLSSEQRAAIKARQREAAKAAAADQKRQNDKAARQAMHTWSLCSTEGRSPYLERKGVGNYGGKFAPSGAFVIPMHDTHGRIHGLQVIRPEKKAGRDKDFWPAGLAKKGHFFQIGRPEAVVLIAEGYATGATLHAATGLPVVIAFDAGNLPPVAQAIHGKYKTAKILVCADDDYLTAGNPGIAAASAAALAVGGAYAVPEFATDREGQKITDYNDLQAREGLAAVRAQIEARITALGWSVMPPSRAESAHTGGGDKHARRQAQSVMPLDEIVERFVPLDDGTGELVFDRWTAKIAKKAQMLALLPAGVRGDDIKRHPEWVQRGAVYFDQVGFDPAGDDSAVVLNTWKGWPTKPRAGACERMLELLQYLCSTDKNAEAVYRWLLCWLAYPLQFPGAKMSSAVIMHGPQGTGKSTLFKAVAQIYGDGDAYRNYSVILDQKALQSDFNADWDSKLFVLAEEVVNSSEKWQLKNELKELVTGPRIRINKKFVDAYYQTNRCNMVFLSNEHHPLPIDNDDRRHLVVYTPPALSESFYDELYDELAAGGVAALYDYLLHLDLSGFHPQKRPPMTEAKRRLIDLSAPSEQRFIYEWVEGDLGLPLCPCLAADLYTAYTRWCRMNGEPRPRAANQFHGALVNMAGWDKKKARIYPSESAVQTEPKPLVFPPPHLLEAAGTAHPDGQSAARWHTDSVTRFSEALNARGDEGERWSA